MVVDQPLLYKSGGGGCISQVLRGALNSHDMPAWGVEDVCSLTYPYFLDMPKDENMVQGGWSWGSKRNIPPNEQ